VKRKHYISILVIALLVVVVSTNADAQCVMCKATAESNNTAADEEAATVGAGINSGILYMMAIPYILLFLFFRKRIIRTFKEIWSINK
jgi:hypothetical protein